MHRRDVIDAITKLVVGVRRSHPTRVAIDGVDASGKTRLADELYDAVTGRGRAAIRASIDGFHNSAAARYRRGKDSPDGYYLDSFNHKALLDNLLLPLGPGGTRVYRRAVFDFRIDAPVDALDEVAPEDAVLLFDGVFLLRSELRAHWDFSIFVEASFDVTMARAKRSDLTLLGTEEAVEERYTRRYIPGQLLYLAACRPQQIASVVLENNNPAAPTLRGFSGARRARPI